MSAMKLVFERLNLTKQLKEMLVFLAIMIIVFDTWTFLELLLEGKIEQNNLDTAIAIVLSVSLYKNYQYQKAKEDFLKWLQEQSKNKDGNKSK